MEEFKTVVFKKYAVFNGRARRREFWMFMLFSVILSTAFSALDAFLPKILGGVEILSWLYSLVILVPAVAVGVRRLHDTNHSGWWYFIPAIPFVVPLLFLLIPGMAINFLTILMPVSFIALILGVVSLLFLVTDSTPGDNQYGPNPKGVPAAPVPSAPSVA